jgi:hypothetical protein
MSTLIKELTSRWRQIFIALSVGKDVSPGLRLRTEGIMEAVILLEEGSPEELQKLMDSAYSDVFGVSLAKNLGTDWQEFFAFPQIPAMAIRAPVYPSTRD